MSKVFVLDALKQPLTPVHPGRARLLLTVGKAAVYRRYPFTIILKREVEHPAPAPLRLKIDPGAKTTGLALVDDVSGEVVWAAELTHRGAAIKKALDTRRNVRRGRRSRKTRYRAPRFANRKRKKGWLPPSLISRVENILTCGYQTGDVVRAVAPECFACRGTHVGRVAVKASGYFTITTAHGKVSDVPHRFCKLIGRTTGYSYQIGERHAALPPNQPIRNGPSFVESAHRWQ
jgi:hypothetical protein